MREPYYILIVKDSEGNVLYCTSKYGDKNNGVTLGFEEIAPFGGIKFYTKKQAWWYWFKYLETHPEKEKIWKPEVLYFEP